MSGLDGESRDCISWPLGLQHSASVHWIQGARLTNNVLSGLQGLSQACAEVSSCCSGLISSTHSSPLCSGDLEWPGHLFLFWPQASLLVQAIYSSTSGPHLSAVKSPSLLQSELLLVPEGALLASPSPALQIGPTPEAKTVAR